MADDKDLNLLRKEIGKGLTDDEWALFIATCRAKELDPFQRQVLPVKVGGKVQHLTTIDGYRLIAARSGEYEGQTGPFWCGLDGQWVDVWLKTEPPTACKIGVMRRGFREPLMAVARFWGYAMVDRNGKPMNLWRKMPDLMLAKVTEALALRKAFPNELSGLYTREEMDQADNPERPAVAMQEAVKVTKEVMSAPVEPDGYEGLPRSMAGRPKLVKFAKEQRLNEEELINHVRMAQARIGFVKGTHKWDTVWADKVLDNLKIHFEQLIKEEVEELKKEREGEQGELLGITE